MLIEVKIKQNSWNDFHVALMTNTSHVEALVKNVVDFLRWHEFEGLYLTFYPFEEEKVGFMNLISALKKAFQPQSFLLAVEGNTYDTCISTYISKIDQG